MRRTPVALISIAVALIVAGCSNERDTTAPKTIAPRASSSGVNLVLTCDPNNVLPQAGKKYMPANDSVFSYISQLKTDVKTSAATATPAGFNILSRVAAVRRANTQIGTADQGAAFVLAVLGCISVGPIADSFHPADVLGRGIFEVRTSGSSEGPAVAFTALTAGSTLPAVPEWGAERSSSSAVWPSVAGTAPLASNRYLVYGYPLGASVAADGFELGTLPHANSTTEVFDPRVNISGDPLAVGICTSSSITVGGKQAVQLLVHDGLEILNLHSLNFCSQSFTLQTPSSWIRSLPGRLLALARPTTLFAQDDGLDSKAGGLPSGWTPFTLESFINSDYTLTFNPQPVNTKLSNTAGIPIGVVVSAALGATTPPMNVRLTIANNSGQPAFLTVPPSTTPVDHVDAQVVNGVASFQIGFTKAGGYTLTAVGFIGGGSGRTPAKISNLFNVKNQ